VGDQLSSNRLEFYPGPVLAGEYAFAIDTAGSATLVAQTVLPALMMAAGISHVTVRGGTHNPLAPTFDFMQRVVLPILRRMGVDVTGEIARYGFFPVGGGELSFKIQRPGDLRGVVLAETGKLLASTVEAVVANLPQHIGQREVAAVVQGANWQHLQSVVKQVNAPCPGNVLTIEFQFEQITELMTSLGRRGLPAERVAADCLRQAHDYLDHKVPVGRYLADQLLLPMAIAAHYFGQSSEFVTHSLSSHCQTHIHVIQRFLRVDVEHAPTAAGIHIRTIPSNGRASRDA
jgi:RNA 3'-terminal phosphate cyclase (ATP)